MQSQSVTSLVIDFLTRVNTPMQQTKPPVAQYYYSESEWTRLGCGPLPEKRRRDGFQQAHAKGNPPVDGKAVKGYN